jgi:Asp-tRNA(Asn)/Glu-tRNA(Gln) amidotransferase A subunit family amidase
VPTPERAPLWAERVRISLADVERLAAAACPLASEPIGLPKATPPRTNATVSPTESVPSAGPAAGPLAALVAGVTAGRIDPVARVQSALAAIAANETLNAFRHVDAQRALAHAHALRQRAGRGERLGRLAGVLVAVKDCFHVAGLPSTCGTRSVPVEVPERSAPCVERLLQEDAIVVGMTTMHELAYGATTDNPHFGPVRHPMDPARLPGGSSGGSAVAVACGMADVSLGTDTAGSVRMPAAICGISGFKPTYGVVPTSGVLPLAWSLDHVGTFGTSASDHALLTEVMGGLPAGSLAADVPATVGATVISNYVLDFVDPEVKVLYLAALQRLRAGGVLLDEQVIDGLELAPTLQYFTIAAEAAQVHADRALRRPEGLGEEVRVRLESGQFVRAVDYLKAQRLRTVLHDALMAPLHAGSHVLVTPAVVIAAPLPAATVAVNGEHRPIHPTLTRCTLPFNLTGMPAIAIPCGRTSAGMPVGIQLAAARGDDARLLAIAVRCEELLETQL